MKLFKSFILGLLCASALWGAITFPTPNNSHIVDEAGLFSASQKVSLEGTLSAHESATTNQIVVVTLTSLQGYDIADFGYQLGRAWGIGTKEHNNGVLLIIAPNERKVRIEVGYGLEGSLPDATASSIIQNTILPAFKAKNYFEGANNGITAIISAIKGEYKADETTQKSSHHSFVVPILFFFFMVFNAMLSLNLSSRRKLFPSLFISAIAGIISWFIFSMIVFSILITCAVFLLSYVGGAFGGGTLPNSWGSSSGGSSSSGGFGGFSGGGGSFGGGGASGSW
ncbi:TPM domain-containing protein [Sulfurospirillum oryzae]|uniref:TPM domain-containing protein n=1 Tax=Sulfurospirillum oryzae TaxID=2976535 RepID=UPI0021E88595|nr:TPM domain-containing protein [Sulfurospirillum oryzae]